MGIHGIYQEIGRGERIALSKLAVDKFEQSGRPLRIAIDVSIWLFQIQASKGGTNPAPRTFYYRLLRLIALSIHPVFVFDGPNKPPFKRGKRSGANVSSIPDFLAKQLIRQFGFPIHHAPGEAEAECALLQREGIVDAVLSEDVDTLMFGSGLTIRNWSAESKSGKSPTHVNVYDAVKTKSGPSGLDREGMILVALMSGGDYVPEGIPGCGPKTACEAARAGFGRDLCRIIRTDKAAMREWRDRLQHELKNNESKYFKRKHGTIKIPDDFPRLDILGYYTHPVVSSQAGLNALRRSMKWDQEIDFPGLRGFTNDAFDWIRLEGAKHFIRSLAPSLLVRGLRMRAESEHRAPDDLTAIKEDEASLVKGIHGRRQHPITDNTAELRVSFTPIELVKLDLSQEEPDDIPSTENALGAGEPTEPSADAELDIIDLDEEEEPGSRKRGPTKFDPTKPVRAWVLETFVKAGVPLAAEDWEAGQRRPKRAATSKEPSKAAPKTRATRNTRMKDDKPQPSIAQFAKVTKPGTKRSQALSRVQKPSQQYPAASQHAKPTGTTVIELLSSSPVKSSSTVPPQQDEEKSPPPVQEQLPPSITKRRKRGPIQRSHTTPADLGSSIDRPLTPPLFGTIDTLDLVCSPVLPSPSLLPAKKARTRATRDSPATRPARQNSMTAASPSKTRQTTLDAWATPTKSQNKTQPAITAPIPAPPRFQASMDVFETLDLTISSPPKPPTRSQPPVPSIPTTRTDPRRLSPSTSSSRPPLRSISSNASPSASMSRSTSRPNSKPASSTRRTSPRVRKPSSAEIDTLDLTQLSSPRLAPTSTTYSSTFTEPPLPADPSTLRSARQSKHPESESASSLRRSPRNHNHSTFAAAVPKKPYASPSAPCKPHAAKTAKKKREIQLRQSIPGTFSFKDAGESPPSTVHNDKDKGIGTSRRKDQGASVILKGKARRIWRESQIEVLDLVD